MFRAIRIFVLLLILLTVSVSTYLSEARSTDWEDPLYVKVYPINADGSREADRYIRSLEPRDFAGIETFMQRAVERYGRSLSRPVRVKLGRPIAEQPPGIDDPGNVVEVVWWSLRLRLWAASIAGPQDDPAPDVRIFLRYHAPVEAFRLDNSVGLQKGMVGIVNAVASRHYRGMNNVVIAHEFLHTLGATDKYDRASGHPTVPDGLAEPMRKPLYPQRYAEIMGGRISLAADDSIMPKSLKYARVGPLTAAEVGLK